MAATATPRIPRRSATATLVGMLLLGSVLWCSGTVLPAVAAGFYLPELGSPLSSGTSAVSNVTNNITPDAAWSNPAGLTGVRGPAILAGVTLVAPVSEWDGSVAEAGGINGSNAGQPAAIPSLHYSQPLTDKWTFGVSLGALQGGGVDYGNNFVGRYAATMVRLQGLGVTWSFGYRATERLALGFGATLVDSDLEQEVALNQSAVGAPDGAVELKNLNDYGIQPILGLQYQATDRLLLGLSYRGQFDTGLSGDVRFKNLSAALPVPPEAKVKLDWTNPQWLEGGIAYRVTADKFLLVSANWQDWSEFSRNQVRINLPGPVLPPLADTIERDWHDTWSAGVAFGTRQRDFRPDAKLAASGWLFGVAYERSPVSDGHRTIDLPYDESWRLSAGYFRHRRDSWDWGAAASLQLFGDAAVDQTSQGVRFAGDFKDFYVVYLSATMRFLK